MKLKVHFLLVLALLLSSMGFAQKINMEHLKDMKPRNIGPAGMSGRVTSIDVDLSDTDIIYAGTASGGVWKSTNGGINWKPIFDKQPVISIGAVTINQNNPSEVWVGTGEGNPRNSHNSGGGVYRSLDAGKTWKLMGLEKTINIHRIIVHQGKPGVIYVGAMGSIWGPNPERGVYRSTDGGESWDLVLSVNDETGTADMVVDPSNPNKIIVALWEFGRKPWTFNSGGKGSGLYVTHDGGDNWVRRSSKNGLPKGNLGRIGLAIAPSKPNIVYALVEAKENGLYKSTDGGENFKLINKTSIGGRPFYYADIFVDPQNENRIYNLHSLVDKSEDGGKTFQTLLPYYGVHPDHHAWWIHPEDPSYMIDGNDGGLNITRDGGVSWQFASNMPLAQFYHISYDMDIPYNVAGGMQDNGSWVGPAYLWQGGGIRNHEWQEVYFGDGFDVLFRPDDNRYVYAMSQQGRVGLVDRETGKNQYIVPTHPDDSTKLRFNWNAAIAQDPFEDCGIYFGSQFVHYSDDCGNSWTILSPDLSTNDTSKQKQMESGGLTIDATGAENYTTILAIAPSPVDKNVIWVGTDDGNLQLTKDRGQTWTNLADRLPGAKAGVWIPYIEVSQKNAGEAFVIANDYRRNDFSPMAYHTTDFGETWKQIADKTQVRGYAHAIVQDPVEPNLLFLGTDNGLYVSIDGAANWTRFTNGYPAASTIDLKIHPREHDLIIGTFGRAAWILDDIRPLREMAKTSAKVLEEEIAIFEAPDAYQAAYKSFDGFHFPADAIFAGENRRSGAMLSVWRKPPASKMKKVKTEMSATDTKKVKKKKKGAKMEEPAMEEAPKEKPAVKLPKDNRAKFHVIDASGDTIRTFSNRIDTGINRIYWNMNRNGIEYPSRNERRPDADPPNGPSVLPGTYRVAVEFGPYTDETTVEVKMDPRIPNSMSDLRANDAAIRKMETTVTEVTKSYKRLQAAKKTIKRVNTALENASEEDKKEILKLGKETEKAIAELEKLFMSARGQRGSDNLSSTLRTAGRYLSTIDGAPNQAAQRAVAKAERQSATVVAKVDTFFKEAFQAYQKKVETTNFSLFGKE